MPPILVSSSTKRIATQNLVISKLNKRKYFILRNFLCDIKRPSKLFKNVRIKNEALEQCQSRHSSVFIANREHISSFVLIVEFEQENVCWIHIEMTNTFGDKIGHITRYVAVFSVWTKFSNKWHLNIYHYNPMGESVRNFLGVYFRWWFRLKICGSHSKLPPVNLSFRRFCSLKD